MHRGLSGIGQRATGIGKWVRDGQFSRSSTKRWTSFLGASSLLENLPNFKINERHLDGRWQR